MKRWLLSKIITPNRVRRIIARVLSWLMHACIVRGAWSAVSAFPPWLRRIADFIEGFDATEFPKEKDRLIADLVADAVTDEAVDRLVDRVAALRVEQAEAARLLRTENGRD